MSFHEITGNYPWLVRRIAYLHADKKKSQMPPLNPFAWLLGIFVPKISIMSIIIIYFIFILGFGAVGFVQGMKETLDIFKSSYEFEDEYNSEEGFYESTPPIDVNPQETEDIIRELQEKLNKKDVSDGENP
ncbi:MAG: hypothetical protein AAF244_04195, partial [Pseudomonadota bacterium]